MSTVSPSRAGVGVGVGEGVGVVEGRAEGGTPTTVWYTFVSPESFRAFTSSTGWGSTMGAREEAERKALAAECARETEGALRELFKEESIKTPSDFPFKSGRLSSLPRLEGSEKGGAELVVKELGSRPATSLQRQPKQKRGCFTVPCSVFTTLSRYMASAK